MTKGRAAPVPSVLCAGLSPAWQQVLVFDELRVGEVNRAREVHWLASGKVINAARCVHRLGGRCRALTFRGGPEGERMAAALTAEGIESVLIPSATPTRVCTTLVVRGGPITELVQNAGPAAPADLEEFASAFRRAARGAAAVVLTGSLPEGAPQDHYRSLLDGISSPVVLDARGPELVAALGLRPFLVKPNREELARTVGRPLAGERALRAAMIELEGLGARGVLITEGRADAWLLSNGKFHRFRPPAIAAVNPIGSGDCLAGGIAHALAAGAGLVEAVRTGMACAADNAAVLLNADVDRVRIERRRAEVAVESA